jgi:tape measure domain-containing protein
MVTENVDIRFRESGARVIKRRIDEIGEAANRSTRGIFLLQRAIFVLGGAGAIRALTTQADLLTNVENRLRLTTTSAQNLEEVQTRLFQVARDSRTSFESVAEIYNRTALSVRQLGISQQETARFTESLAKASILSGASTREANAALIQLSQGLASNRLSGDELRSVLEQLPFVADVIARQLGITRGELRQFGREGKISAEVVLEAFRNAEEEIDRLFAQTQPTISQALSVANTNWLEFLDNLEDTFQISSKVANAIIFLSENIELIVGTLGAAAAAFALSFGIRTIQSIANFTLSLRAGAVASARLLEVENLRAAASVRRTQAAVASNAARQAELQQRLALLQLKKADLQQTVLDTQFTVANGRARNIATGQFVALSTAKANLARVTQQLSIVEGVEAATAGRLATARAAQTGATTTAAAANARLAAAQAASAGTTARLTRLFPTLAGGIGLAGRAMAGLGTLLAANPIGAAVVAVVAATAAFLRWGNEIKVTSDGVVGLKDAVVAAFQLIIEAIAPVADFLRRTIGDAIKAVIGFFASLGDEVRTVMDFVINLVFDAFTFFPRVAVSAIAGIVAAFDILPQAASSAATSLANALIAGFEAFANGAINAINLVIDAINALISFVGGDKAAELFGFSGQIGRIGNVELSRFVNEYEGAGKAAANAFGDAFATTFEATNLENTVGAVGTALEPIGQAITERARQNIANAAEEAVMAQDVIPSGGTTPTTPGGGGGGGGGGSQRADFASIISGMQQEIELLGLSVRERERANEILKIEKELKRSLTDAERALADQTLRALEAAKTQADVLESIEGPRREAAERQMALNELFRQGRIDINDYTTAIREMQQAADEASGTLFGGFRSSISAAIMSAGELGTALGDWVVGAADKASDAIVEFAKTGQFNVRQFFNDLFSQLLKLAAQQILLRLLSSIVGVPLGGGGGGGIAGLFGFNSGGSILPSGPGSTDSQVVAFKKRPDERVDILTPGQQAAQQQQMNNGESGSSSNVSVSPKIINVLDPGMVGQFLDTPEGETAIVNTIERTGILNRGRF